MTTEMILPGTYIQVRPEGLIMPSSVSVNNVGVAGTAGKGPVDTPTLLSSYTQAREIFGDYDAWDPDNPEMLTLVRALEQIFTHGANTVWAVRIADGEAKASYLLSSDTGPCVRLEALSAGEWGNDIEVNVAAAETHSFVSDETQNGGAALTLNYPPVVQSARNRITQLIDADQRIRTLNLVYGGDTAGPGQVHVNADGTLTFAAGEEPAAADTVTASYVVDQSASAKVMLRYGLLEEVFTIANGNDLAADINNASVLATATADANAAELPSNLADFMLFGTGTNTRGDNGTANIDPSDYKAGLDTLMNENAHIMVAAGQSHTDIGADLTAHVAAASSDLNKRERIGVVGSALGDNLDAIRGHDLNSDRIVFVAPGIVATDAATGNRVTLPGAYTAAAVAGLLASNSPHVSPTNKRLPVVDLQHKYTNADLSQLVQSRVLVLQDRLGFKVVKGITTSTNTAWHQITTRRIVDYAKFGVRSAADPFIGLLNNARVRGALKTSINSFLVQMLNDEMLIAFELDVSATREEEVRGIARVTVSLQPTFSIDFIVVTMFLS
jgi:hypothetical protein